MSPPSSESKNKTSEKTSVETGDKQSLISYSAYPSIPENGSDMFLRNVD
jgi:hypothetical protein